jgi:hypothetical protein
MKSIFYFIAVIICASSIASASGNAPGLDPDVSYSATRIIRAGDRTYAILEWRAPGKLRLDTCSERLSFAYLVREDLHETFTVGRGSYVRGGYPGPYDPRHETFRVTEAEAVAQQEINGATAEKYRASFRLGHGQVGEGFYWVQHGILVRVELTYTEPDGTERSIVMELEDLVIGEQDPALFEVPPGLSDITNSI